MAQSPRILVIDDDPMIVNLAAAHFEKLTSQKVSTAFGGQAGYDLFCKHPSDYFDIITIDLYMPDVDGVQLLRMFAEQGYNGAVAFLSAVDDKVLNSVEELAVIYQLQNLGSIKKPFNRDDLAGLLESHKRLSVLKKGREYSENLSITVDELKAALNDNQFSVYYQPKVCTQTRRLIGVEALCRWFHPQKGSISPVQFIPLAEENGLINNVTRFVIQRAFADTETIRKVEREITLSVNVSMDDVTDLAFPEYIADLANKYQISAYNITLEVTESRITDQVKSATEVLTRLKLMGMNLSIDDFGTGYSTFEKLKKLPFNEIKIDKSFVSKALENKQSKAIVESNIDLGKKLRINTVAEGVETKSEWDYISSLGCDMVQGFFIAKPMPLAEFVSWGLKWKKLVP